MRVCATIHPVIFRSGTSSSSTLQTRLKTAHLAHSLTDVVAKASMEYESALYRWEKEDNFGSRLIIATFGATKAGCNAFLSTGIVMIPVGMVLNVGKGGGLKGMFQKGYSMGLEWGRISALFSAGDIFCAKFRNIDDKWNSFIGSGIGSAALRAQEGPLGIAQGFVVGFGFMYMFDRLTSNSSPTIGPDAVIQSPKGKKIHKKMPRNPQSPKLKYSSTFHPKKFR